MRVLIVDGFSQTQQGRREFGEFRTTVERSLETAYHKLFPSIAVAIRDVKDLGNRKIIILIGDKIQESKSETVTANVGRKFKFRFR
jgi:hypothetical protein